MALIRCPECGHEISEYATHCVSCGCPMLKIKEIYKTKSEEAKAKTEKIKVEHFYSLRNDYERLVIDEAVRIFKERQGSLYIANERYKYSIGLGDFFKHQIYFWFSKGSKNELLIKYYLSPGVSNEIISQVAYKNNIAKIMNNVFEAMEPKKPHPKVEPIKETRPVVTLDSVEEVAGASITKIENPSLNKFYKYLDDFVNYRSYKLKNAEFNELAQEFRDDLEEKIGETIPKLRGEIIHGFFRSTVKYYGFPIYVFGDQSAQWGKYYQLFKTEIIIKYIEQYEKIFNVQIICSKQDFYNELLHMLLMKKISINSCKSLTSSFALVPQNGIDEILKKYGRFE